MERGRISVRSAHDDHIEHAAVAADEAFTRIHLGEPAKPRSVRGRFCRSNPALPHESFEQHARFRRFFFTPRPEGFDGKAAGQLHHDKLRRAKPQWNTLDVRARTFREQHGRLERGFHGRNILGWYQYRLHRPLTTSAVASAAASVAASAVAS